MHEKMAYWFLIAVTIISVFVAGILYWQYRNFSYTLQKVPAKSIEIQGIEITGGSIPRSVKFTASFVASAGVFDVARLKRKNNVLKIVFYDLDGKREKHLQGYVVTGEIKGLKTKEYELQIYGNVADKVLLSKKVTIL